jgi:hypothetical protein
VDDNAMFINNVKNVYGWYWTYPSLVENLSLQLRDDVG